MDTKKLILELNQVNVEIAEASSELALAALEYEQRRAKAQTCLSIASSRLTSLLSIADKTSE